MKILKIIVFAVGTYYILRFVIRLYNARQKMHSNTESEREKTSEAKIKKPVINPNAGEYTDYEEVKD